MKNQPLLDLSHLKTAQALATAYLEAAQAAKAADLRKKEALQNLTNLILSKDESATQVQIGTTKAILVRSSAISYQDALKTLLPNLSQEELEPFRKERAAYWKVS